MGDLASEIKEKVVGPIVLDKQVFDEICRAVCPHCRKGWLLRYRPETVEYVHDNKTQVDAKTLRIEHVACWASGFRKSRFAEAIK